MTLGRWGLLVVLLAMSVGSWGCGGRASRRTAAGPDERADARVHGSRPPPPTTVRGRQSATSIAASTSGFVAMTSDETALSTTVERRQTPEGDYTLIAGFTVDAWVVRVTALPSRYPDHVGLALVSPVVRSHVYSDCPVRVMADGQMLLAPEPESVGVSPGSTGGYHERLNVIVPRTELATMATSDRLVVRVCDTELRLGPEHRAVLAEMLLRVDEEQRWLASEPRPVQDLTPDQPFVAP
jgi:hypothetical protein